MAELSDINKTLLEQNKLLKESQGGSATAQAKAAEQAAERRVYDASVLDTLKSINSTMGQSFKSMSGGDKKSGGMIAGMLGGIGGALGGVIKAVSKIGLGFGIGMGALGLGIAAFALAIGGASKIAEMMGGDSGALAMMISTFFDGFNEENTAKMGVLIGLAAMLAGFKVKGRAFAGAMTGLAMGIVGFAGGILLGESILGYGLSEMGAMDGSSIALILTNFFTSLTPEIAAKLGVIVTIAGLLAGFNVKGREIAGAMTGIGAGIVGFAGGILLGEALVGYGLAAMGGLDGSSIALVLQNFFGAMSKDVIIGLGTIVTIAGIATKLGITDLKGSLGIMMGMTAIGAGIAGFSLGIILADGAAKLGAMANLDGSSLKTLIGNFMGAFDGVGFVALGALITAGAVLGTALGPAALVAVPLGMGAIGLGIAAFMVPLLAADWIAGLGGDNAGGNLATLLTNIGRGIGGFLGGFVGSSMKQMEEIDGDKLAQIGRGIADLGVGMIAFAGGRAAGGIADIAGGIGNAITGLFGGEKKGPLHIFAEISKDTSINANRLSELGTGISDLAVGLKAFADVSTTGLIGNSLALSEIGLPDIDSIDFKKLKMRMPDQTLKTDAIEKKVSGFKEKSSEVSGKSGSVTIIEGATNNYEGPKTVNQTTNAVKLNVDAVKEE
jgi:hypothetical protein